MDAQRVRDLTDELRLMARAKPAWKPALHRAARALEETLPTDDRKALKGRYGGRAMPGAFRRSASTVDAAPRELQAALFLAKFRRAK
jgi:hypothetical protein